MIQSFVIDTRQPVICSSNHIGHIWDTHSALFDQLFHDPWFVYVGPKLFYNYVISSRYLKQCNELYKPFVSVI